MARGYNPYRIHGKFASGPHKKRIAKARAREAKYRAASALTRRQMIALKRQARGKSKAVRESLKKRFDRLAAKREKHKARAADAKQRKVAAQKRMQEARAKHREKMKSAGRGASRASAVKNQTSHALAPAHNHTPMLGDKAREILGHAEAGRLNEVGHSLNAMLAERGFAPGAHPNKSVFVSDHGLKASNITGLDVEASGLHHWDGRIQLSSAVAKSLQDHARVIKGRDLPRAMEAASARERQAFSARLGTKSSKESKSLLATERQARDEAYAHWDTLQSTDTSGLRTAVHESLHGFGPGTDRSYRGHGARIEEITTETTARVVGHETFSLPLRHDFGAYTREIVSATAAISEVTGHSRERSWDILQRASERYKRRSDRFHDPESVLHAFASDIAHEGGGDPVQHTAALRRHFGQIR